MTRKTVLGLLLLQLCWYANADSQVRPGDLAHTYSIVARDPDTGEMGVAVQTHWFAVGRRVPWAEAGVGAIATQSFTNASFGPRGLAMIKAGKTAQEVVDSLIASDEGRDFRQLAVVDHHGNVAAYTGKKCIKDAGHFVGDNFAVQANLMLNANVWPAMAAAFENSSGPLAERLLRALQAGQAAGGDIRGKQSAALIVVKPVSSGKVWQDRLVDLRVDDHSHPVQELERLLRIHRAYEHMNAGDQAMENGDTKSAEKEYGAAEELYPQNLEMRFWHAVSLANAGQVAQALPIFAAVFRKDGNWRTLTGRLPASDLLKVSPDDLQRILHLE